ncbi:MAG: glycosyltransferase [Candidatus Omnitrophica bacterium]|nr:glycosyltransferase [Candidatus Omnitrophota bacterium]
MKIDIIILNYNGRDLLEKYLPSVCAAAIRSVHDSAVYVLDNCSSDSSRELVAGSFPGVGFIPAPRNLVLFSYNAFVAGLDSDVVILLNTDMKAEPDFIDPLVAHFSNEKIMFAAPRLMNFDGTFNGGKSFLGFSLGAVKMRVDYDNFMSGGKTHSIATGAFRRDAFVSMGGFDDLYLPGIWEEVDLCFRAMCLGWEGVYEPRSVVFHDESTTFHREYGKKRKMTIAHRNMFLFIWKNVREKDILFAHILLTLPRILVLLLKGQDTVLIGFIGALKRLPLALKKRALMKTEFLERKYDLKDFIG